jgi:hypothetical protein
VARGKEFPLSIVLRTVDRATAGLSRFKAQLQGITAPVRNLSNRLRAIGTAAGFPELVAGFRGVGSAALGLARSVGAIAVAAGLGVAGLKSLIDHGDKLAKTADQLGIGIDALSQLRFAAQQSGVEDFDGAMEQLSKRMGELKSGSGELNSLMGDVAPNLRKQLAGAKDAEEGLSILADAMTKIEDPTKRARLATAAFGRSGMDLILMLQLGSAGIDKLKQEALKLEGPQARAARQSDELGDAMGRVTTAAGGWRAALIEGIGPSLTDLANRLAQFVAANREAIAAWAIDFGKKLPGRIDAFIKAVKRIGQAIKPVWDAIGGASGAVKILAALLAGKLVMAFVTLGRAMLTTPFGLFVTAISVIVLAVQHFWDELADFGLWIAEVFGTIFGPLWDGIVGVFRFGLTIVRGILKAITFAVEKAVEAVKFLADLLASTQGTEFLKKQGRGAIEDFIASRRGPLELSPRQLAGAGTGFSAGAPTPTVVKLDITGAPRGSRAEVKPGSGDVDLSMGYTLGTP